MGMKPVPPAALSGVPTPLRRRAVSARASRCENVPGGGKQGTMLYRALALASKDLADEESLAILDEDVSRTYAEQCLRVPVRPAPDCVGRFRRRCNMVKLYKEQAERQAQDERHEEWPKRSSLALCLVHSLYVGKELSDSYTEENFPLLGSARQSHSLTA